MLRRVTQPTLAVLDFLLQCFRDGEATWGFEVANETGLKGGTIYPILNRLVIEGWLTSYWDDRSLTGPRRRMYKLSATGAAEAAQVLTNHADRVGVRAWATS